MDRHSKQLAGDMETRGKRNTVGLVTQDGNRLFPLTVVGLDYSACAVATHQKIKCCFFSLYIMGQLSPEMFTSIHTYAMQR